MSSGLLLLLFSLLFLDVWWLNVFFPKICLIIKFVRVTMSSKNISRVGIVELKFWIVVELLWHQTKFKTPEENTKKSKL